ncbi:hypothetical protein ABR36_11685, partial [Enterobacter ludwigii]
ISLHSVLFCRGSLYRLRVNPQSYEREALSRKRQTVSQCKGCFGQAWCFMAQALRQKKRAKVTEIRFIK